MADQQACTYAALLLHDSGVAISHEALAKVIAAAGVTVRPTLPVLYATYLASNSVSSLVSKAGNAAPAATASAAAPAAGAAAAAPAAGKKEEKKKVESEDDEMGFGLFD